jgi:hypothetical protein
MGRLLTPAAADGEDQLAQGWAGQLAGMTIPYSWILR